MPMSIVVSCDLLVKCQQNSPEIKGEIEESLEKFPSKFKTTENLNKTNFMNYKPESRIYLAAGKLVGIIASSEKLVLQHGLKYLRGIPTLTVPMHISQLPSLLVS